jgi:hypothetical protein
MKSEIKEGAGAEKTAYNLQGTVPCGGLLEKM